MTMTFQSLAVTKMCMLMLFQIIRPAHTQFTETSSEQVKGIITQLKRYEVAGLAMAGASELDSLPCIRVHAETYCHCHLHYYFSLL